jgi:hypothetical protein
MRIIVVFGCIFSYGMFLYGMKRAVIETFDCLRPHGHVGCQTLPRRRPASSQRNGEMKTCWEPNA